MINEERMLQTFKDLVTVYAPSKGEKDVAAVIRKKLEDLGADSIVEDNHGSVEGGNSGNLIAVFNATEEGHPSIALTGHMDCVENCKNIQPYVKDGVIYSRGPTILGADDKAGVTAILEGIARMKEEKMPHGKVTVIFTVQEEIGLNGSRNIEKQYIQGIDYGYTFDNEGAAGTASNFGPAHYTLDFICHGRASHAGMSPEKGVSAIAMAARGIDNCPNGRIDEETTCNIGKIEGGLATNIVPDCCVVHAEARSRDMEKLENLIAAMEKAFIDAEISFPGSHLEIKKKKEYDPFHLPEDSPVCMLFKKACYNAGFTCELAPTGGGSDANWFGTKGFPALLVGCGMQDYHTPDEHITLKDLYEAGELARALIEEAGKETR